MSQIKYLHDVAVLKDYGGRGCKLIVFKSLRQKGFEDDKKRSKGSVNEEKLDENIIRARSRVFELAYCNDWQFFTTFTIDPKKFGRNDLEKFQKSFAQWLRNYNKKFGTQIRYLTIPEQHQKGGWHEHGFICGVPQEHLRQFTLKERLPTKLRKKLLQGDVVFDWPAYREKYGWVDFEPIRSVEGVSKYCTKYITKALSHSVTASGAHLYYCSKGLNRATEIKKGSMSGNMEASYDFENDWVKVKWYNTSEPLSALADMIVDD